MHAAGVPSPSPRLRAPPGPGNLPRPALPSQLRLHLEEIAQSIPVGTVDPVIQDDAPSPGGHTGGDRRAGRGGAGGHRDFEHLRGGTPEAAAAAAAAATAAAGACSPAARRLRKQDRERGGVLHTHAHTHRLRHPAPPPPPRAGCGSPPARSGGRVGGEGGEPLRAGVEREPGVTASRRDEGEAPQSREIPSPSLLPSPPSPPPARRAFPAPLPFPFLPPRLWLPRCQLRAAPDAGAWRRHRDQGASSHMPSRGSRPPGRRPRAVG